ncbi:MAG: hypothetical protein LUI01_00425 [Firmicutes bacterium]|nr:hypothetical protein [Bacillota bacterium]
MKKILILILALAICFSVVSCADSADSGDNATGTAGNAAEDVTSKVEETTSSSSSGTSDEIVTSDGIVGMEFTIHEDTVCGENATFEVGRSVSFGANNYYLEWLRSYDGYGMQIYVSSRGHDTKIECENGTFLSVKYDSFDEETCTASYIVEDIGSTIETNGSSKRVCWGIPHESVVDDGVVNDGVVDKITVTVYEEGNIIGAALFTVSYGDGEFSFEFTKNVSFPTLGTDYQDITEEELDEFFDR